MAEQLLDVHIICMHAYVALNMQAKCMWQVLHVRVVELGESNRNASTLFPIAHSSSLVMCCRMHSQVLLEKWKAWWDWRPIWSAFQHQHFVQHLMDFHVFMLIHIPVVRLTSSVISTHTTAWMYVTSKGCAIVLASCACGRAIHVNNHFSGDNTTHTCFDVVEYEFRIHYSS